jgi:SAM-dependent methyltransferase
MPPKDPSSGVMLKFARNANRRLEFAKRAKRYLDSWRIYRGVSSSARHPFICNVCNHRNAPPRVRMTREGVSCLYCGSSVRFRSIVHALSMESFGEDLALEDFPVRRDLSGIGLSDWHGYAERLQRKFDYKNTFYHREPFLDIMIPSESEYGKYDFLISTDVYEHVPPPIGIAFHNAFKLLKPGGVMVFSVPYVQGQTREHFPELHKFTITGDGKDSVLVNETADGREQRFSQLCFHGGRGSVLEMRLFGSESLMQHFVDAGFSNVRVCSDEVPERGILWIPYDPLTAPYDPPIYGLDTPPWTARRPM